MTWTQIVNRAFKVEELESYIHSIPFNDFKPSLIVWHNTAAPTLAQWLDSEKKDIAEGRTPGQARILNLQDYFKSRGWSSGPHAFIAPDYIWAFTPFNKKGTHSPSWNGISIGLEMVADFDSEDDETGPGLQVKNNCIALTAILCDRLGLNPETAIKLHKEDRLTTHACPGRNIAADKQRMIASVLEYMGHGGSHGDEPPAVRFSGIVSVDDFLNLRDKSSMSGKVIGRLKNGNALEIMNRSQNGTTEWLYVETSAGQHGWVSAKYVKEIKS